jgi:hypothetical protein
VAGQTLKSSNISSFILGERMLLGIVEVYVHEFMENRVLITCHTPLFRGSIINGNGNGNGNTSPPQIAGHAYDIRYRTKHPIDLQPTLPHPSSSHKTLSLSHFA